MASLPTGRPNDKMNIFKDVITIDSKAKISFGSLREFLEQSNPGVEPPSKRRKTSAGTLSIQKSSDDSGICFGRLELRLKPDAALSTLDESLHDSLSTTGLDIVARLRPVSEPTSKQDQSVKGKQKVLIYDVDEDVEMATSDPGKNEGFPSQSIPIELVVRAATQSSPAEMIVGLGLLPQKEYELVCQAFASLGSISKSSKSRSWRTILVADSSSGNGLKLLISPIWKDFQRSQRDKKSENNFEDLREIVLSRYNGPKSADEISIPPWTPEEWASRDFYSSVYQAPIQDFPNTNLHVPSLTTDLYPFQQRTVQWMLQREGHRRTGPIADGETGFFDDLGLGKFYPVRDSNNDTVFINPYLGLVSRTMEKDESSEQILRGGLLSEEMGLGKTVELVSLISLNQRDLTHEKSDGDLIATGTTLVVCPASILQQWVSEINRHSPSLVVLVYEGLKKTKASNDELTTDILGADIVITSYATLTSEVWYTQVNETKELRAPRKYEKPKSPLVLFDWWRIIIDECQMVESGVTNAARVVNCLSRRNAWAASGTPLGTGRVEDLFGLFLFLRLDAYTIGGSYKLLLHHPEVLSRLINQLVLRHTKDQVKHEIDLPPQARVVAMLPFSSVEQQNYADLYAEMLKDVGIDHEHLRSFRPNELLESAGSLRSWLVRLRQTCLHPTLAEGRKINNRGSNVLRTIEDVLSSMIDQNEIALRLEERAYLGSRLRRGQVHEHVNEPRIALEIWQAVLEQAGKSVLKCREDLDHAMRTQQDHDADEEIHLGKLRARLRSIMEVEHAAIFFIGNAYYQIRTNKDLTKEDSPEAKQLEEMETEAYDKAKVIRKEMLTVSAKTTNLMNELETRKTLSRLVKLKPVDTFKERGGIESDRILERLNILCEYFNGLKTMITDIRAKAIELLLKPLLDQEEAELQGDEYESSTKQQDELYVYMEIIRALIADREDALTGQENLLIRQDMTNNKAQAENGDGHAPELMLKLSTEREEMMQPAKRLSFRLIISQLRALRTNVRLWAGTRSKAEVAICTMAITYLSNILVEQAKNTMNLEKEIELMRDTMNSRLEFYRQLQTISDTVAPWERDLDAEGLQLHLQAIDLSEQKSLEKLNSLRSRSRYLQSLNNDKLTDPTAHYCYICQESYHLGALTSCGHSFCEECLGLWFNQHRNCPVCKRKLARSDLNKITFQALGATDPEKPQLAESSGSAPSVPLSKTSIYKAIDTKSLTEIQNVELPSSFGTKVDAIARHVIWLRHHDPGAKTVIFFQFRSFMSFLSQVFTRFKISFTSIDAKNGTERFKQDAGVECFFLYANAHAAGLNLTNATHVILCEPLINTAIELQAIARVHRIGQHNPTTVWMYVADNTVERAIYELADERRLKQVQALKESVKDDEEDGTDADERARKSTQAIDAAMALEFEDVKVKEMMNKGNTGEKVPDEDLFESVFRYVPRSLEKAQAELQRATRGHLAAEAADARF